MRLLRLALVVLLSFVVPVTAAAGIVAPQAARQCPMRTSGDSMAATPKHDCCDPGHAAHSAPDKTQPHPCKHCQACMACGACAMIPAALAVDDFPATTQIVAALPDSELPGHDPGGLWRPPRTL